MKTHYIFDNHSMTEATLLRLHQWLFFVNVVGTGLGDVLISFAETMPNSSRFRRQSRLILAQLVFLGSVTLILVFTVCARQWWVSKDSILRRYAGSDEMYNKMTDSGHYHAWQIVMKYWTYGRKYTEPVLSAGWKAPFTWQSAFHWTEKLSEDSIVKSSS